MSEKLTVVILNWARPENVRRFAHYYATHDLIERVLIGDNNAWSKKLNVVHGTPVEIQDKITVVGMSDDLGLPSRFALGTLARTNAVLIVDDDIDVADNTIRLLHREFLRNTAGAVGLFGRKPAPDGTYSIGTHHGPVEVLLTRAVITTPQICGEAAWRSVRMARELGGIPFGNGEDIVMSAVAQRCSGHPNLAFNLPYRNVGYDDANAISVRYPQHEAHRSNVVRWCRKHITC